LPEGSKVRIYYDEKEGVLVFEGPREAVEDLEDSVTDLKEEVEKLGPQLDIRVFRVRYIDVNSAAEILDEVFNANRREMLQQVRQQQQAAARQAAIAARQAQMAARQRGQQGGPGQRGQQPNQRNAAQAAQQAAAQQAANAQAPQIPGGIQVYPNPRDRTLIIRANTRDYPDILELLATIDQPQPIEYDLRIIQLKKLNAGEVEEILRGILNLDQASSRGARRGPAGRGGSSTVTDFSGLPKTLMEPTAVGELGVFKDDISITSNAQANTIIVTGPTVGIEMVENLINRLEGEEVPDRMTENFKLKFADAETLTEYLTAKFAEMGGATSGRRPRRGSASSGLGTLNKPTFLAYPRLNMLTVQATDEQMEEVRTLIAELDVSETEGTQYESITLIHADATAVAQTLTQMFGGQASGGPRGRRAPSSPSAITPEFIADEGGNTLFYRAPETIKPEVLATIEKLEKEYSEQVKPKFIELEHAKPSAVAEAIQAAYGMDQRSNRRGKRPTFTITGLDDSQQLSVRADEQTFAEIESLAKSLDKPGDVGFDIRIYKLQHANARKVYTTMSSLIGQYVRSLGRGGTIEPFSVEVDDKSNSLVVLGSPAIFEFLETRLPLVDTPANKESPPGFLMMKLQNANAVELAGNINRVWSQRNLPQGETPPTAEANRSLNAIIVKGTEEQIKKIREEMINPLEELKPPALLTETITLEHAQPEAVAESINRVFEDKRRAYQQIGRGSNVDPLDFTVVVTADVNTKQLVVQANDKNMELVKKRVSELDREDIAAGAATSMKVYQIKYADPNAVVNIINQWSRARSTSGGRQRTVGARDVVTAVAEHGTQTVVVNASEANHVIISGLIDELDSESLGKRERKRHVLALEHANSDEVANQMTQAFRQVRRARGDSGPGFLADAKTNSIIATVNEDELAEVEDLLVALDVPAEEETERTMVVYAVKFADPNAVVNIINSTFRHNRRSQPRPEDQVIAVTEWATQSVIVTASPKNHEQIAELIKDIDQEATGSSQQAVIALQYANSDEVVQKLNEIFGRQQRRNRRAERQLVVSSNPRANTVIVRGSEDEIKEVREVVEMIDVEPQLDKMRITEVYALRYADPGSLNSVINNMFRWDRRSPVSPSEQVTCAVEWATQSVIVTASPENHEIIKKLVEKTDVDSAADKKMQIIPLEFANADEVARSLNNVFRHKRRTRRGEAPVTIEPQTSTNSLVVSATQSEFEELMTLIESLDVEPTEQTKRSMKVYPVKYADPNGIVNVINQTYRWQRRVQPRPEDQVTAVVEWATQSVIVTASEDKHKEIETLIGNVDQESTFKKEQYLYELKNANADDVARSIQQILRQERRSRRGEVPMQVVPLTSTNALLISATAQEYEAYLPLIERIDVEPPQDTQRVMRVYPIKYADPNGIVNVINRTYQGARGSRPRPEDQVNAVAEWGTQTVIVTASPKNQDEIAKLIGDTDVESTITTELYTYKLEQASASDLSRSLASVYRGQRRTRRGEQPIQVNADEGTNTLLVNCRVDEWDKIRSLIEELDVPPEAGRLREIRSFPLRYASPWSVREAVNSLFRGMSRNPRDQVSAVPEAGSNSVIVSASPENMKRIDDLIKDMDSLGSGMQEVHIVKLEYADSASVAESLDEIFVRSVPRQRGGATPIVVTEVSGSNAVLVKANQADFERVMATVEKLDTEEVGVGDYIRVVSLLNTNADEMLEVLNETLRKPSSASSGRRGRGRRGGNSGELMGDVRLSSLAQSNSLVVSGIEKEVERVVTIIEQMDEEGREMNEPKLIRLEFANAADLLPTLESLVSNSGRGGRRGGGSTMQPVISADENLNALLVRAGPSDLAAIERAIELMDTEEAQEAELIRIVPVPMGVNVTELADTLEQQFNASADARPNSGSGGRGRRSRTQVSITADTRTHSLIVAGSAALFDDVERAVEKLSSMGPAGAQSMRVIRPTNLSADEVQQLIDRLKEESSGSSGSSRNRSRRRR
jgi:type II secretory pathway component GspD/PulD (secretin)